MKAKILLDCIVFYHKEGYLKCYPDREDKNKVHFSVWYNFDNTVQKGRAFFTEEKIKEYNIFCNKMYKKLKRKLRKYL